MELNIQTVTVSLATKTGNKKGSIEPSKVVVLPDEAVEGTDTENMQIKEIGGKGRSSKWLAVHIPDNATHFKPIKIISSENAAADLEKIVGPNRETLAKELQTIIGVDGQTLNQMIKDAVRNEKGKSENKEEKDEEEEEENDNDKTIDDDEDNDNAEDDDDNGEEKEEHKDDDGNDNEDDANEDEDDENEDGSAENDEDCKTEHNNEDNKAVNRTTSGDLTSQAIALYEMKAKPCKGQKNKHGDKSFSDLRIPVGKEKNKAKYKNYRAGSGKNEETPLIQEPPEMEMTLADYLNGAKTKKRKENKKHLSKLCKLLKFGAQIFPSCFKHKHKQRHFRSHSKHSHHSLDLDRMFRKLLKTNNGQFDSKMFNALKQLTMDRVQTSKDGNVHVFPHHGPRQNTYEEALNELLEKDPLSRMYNDLPTPGSHMSSQFIKPTSLQSQEPGLTLDNTYNGPAIRVQDSFNHQETDKPFSSLLKGTGIKPATATNLPSPTSSFRNEADKLAVSDQLLHNQMLKQELKLANSEMEEQQRENAKDQSLLNSYFSKISSLPGRIANKQNPFLNQKSGHIGDQQVSVVSPDQVNVLQTQLPANNPDVPGFLSKAKQSLNFDNNIVKKSSLVDVRSLVYRPQFHSRGKKKLSD